MFHFLCLPLKPLFSFAFYLQIFASVSALIANFTAWSVFSSLSKENAPIVLRSQIGKTLLLKQLGFFAYLVHSRLVLTNQFLRISFSPAGIYSAQVSYSSS